jgi:protein TonB
MSDAIFSVDRLKWTGLALFLHAGLLFAVPRGELEPVTPPVAPIQVSLLDPAPEPGVPEQTVTPPEPPPPKPPEPVPPKPRPKPRPAPEPRPAPPPEPLSDVPSLAPVAETDPGDAEAAPESSAPVAVASSAPTGETSRQSVGGGALVEAHAAAYLQNPEPPYPYMSRKMREEGTVELRVFVLADGKVGQVEIKNSSGFHRLDESARVTVLEKYRFVPGRRGDEAIEMWVNFKVVFHRES